MRRRLTVACAVISSAALIGIGAGCGGSSASNAETPSDATTVANNAPQTDSNGKTVPAPGAETTAPTGNATTEGTTTEAPGGGAAAGDVAAGKTAFEASCQGCHPSGGTQAGVGPDLSKTLMDPAQIETQVKNGGAAMPGGLVSGPDLTNVVAYVSSLK